MELLFNDTIFNLLVISIFVSVINMILVQRFKELSFVKSKDQIFVLNLIFSFVLGYNIFDRITKEGRKFGILLGLISQRPAEISETAISQCSNFLIFKMFHPKDLSFIESVIPNIDKNSINKIKALPSGNCMIFGNAFKIPVIVNMKKPEPAPLSNNCDIINSWYIN